MQLCCKTRSPHRAFCHPEDVQQDAAGVCFTCPISYAALGEPDFTASENAVEAGCKAIRDGHTKYSANAGIPELRIG